MATSSCPITLPFDEARWIIRIRRIFDEEIEVSEDQPICVFDVPKPLLSTKPEAYIPQLVALGPYHHCREELCDMERYKLSAAKRAQSNLLGMDFQQLVDVFTKLEHLIRAHYHRHLNLSNETLGWMMAIDVSFLLEFLQTLSNNSTNQQQRALPRIPSRMTHLVDPSRRTSSHSMLLRDIVMLENQVPLFLLLKAIECRCSTAAAQPAAESVLSSMLVGLFQEVCTFRGIGRPCTDVDRHVHLLDFLYSNMVPRRAEQHGTEEGGGDDESCQDQRKSTLNSAMDVLVSRGSKIASVTVDFLLKVLLRFIASLPCLSVLGEPIEQLTTQHAADQPSSGVPAAADKDSSSRSPLLEEIAVPSVAELAYTGVRFCPAVGDLSAVAFCPATATLHLPVIGVDGNTEVVLRNLVAYEAGAGAGHGPSSSLVLARYVELMNGIIDTEEDARVLRECGVVLNYLRSDREVAELWNGMTRSVRLTKVPALDRVIDGLNAHYQGCWKVKVRTFVVARVLGSSRELLACVALVLLFLFVALQAFCVLRGCVPVSLRDGHQKIWCLVTTV